MTQNWVIHLVVGAARSRLSSPHNGLPLIAGHLRTAMMPPIKKPMVLALIAFGANQRIVIFIRAKEKAF
jgi:hypothetical protein